MKTRLTVLLLAASLRLFSQNTIGIPDIINYTKENYNAGMQNWDIAQDKNGIIYFANNEGLLSFDGTYWRLCQLPTKTIVRSVAMNGDKIYVGAQDDFGYFSPDKNGSLVFTSLKPLLPSKDNSFTDIWDIVLYGKSVFFRSKEKIFELNNNVITVYPATGEWKFLGASNNVLIAQDSKNGLLEFVNGMWTRFLKEDVLPEDALVTCFFPVSKDSSMLITLKNGFFILNNDVLSPFKFAGTNPFTTQRILACIPVNKDWIAVATNLEGCFIINKQGEVIQNLSRKEGLQINNVVSLFLDKDDNLWLGLDNGIDFIAYNNAIKHIYPEELNEGAGYSSIIYNNELYVGTSNGLYKIPVAGKKDFSFIHGAFESVANTKGSSWGLVDVNGSLLFAHHDGAFEIKDDKAIPISNHTGYWTFLPFYNVLPSSLVIGGDYNGLDFFEYVNNNFISKGGIKNYNESSQYIAIDNNNIIWVAHPYRGVYKIDVSEIANPKVKLYTDKNGLPSYLRNHLFKVKNHIVVTTEKGVYEYNGRTDMFEPSAYFKNIFQQKNIRYLKEDGDGNIWFVEDKNLGVVDFTGAKPEVIYFPELSGKIVSGFEHINAFDKQNVLVGAEKGFYNINYEQYKKNHYKVQVMVRLVKAFGKSDTTLFGGYYNNVNNISNESKDAINVDYNLNSFHFEYSSPMYVHQSSIEYSYYLEGFDKDWSTWSNRTEKDYTNLPAGNYTFKVKAKNNLGSESAISSYSFVVLPPWYETSWAYLLYILCAITILFIAYKWQHKKFLQQQKKYEEEQKRLQYLHQLEIEKSEKEIVKLKNEKLEAEIAHKNRELASAAMHLVQKGELLANIKGEITHLKNGSNGNGASEEFKKILHIINEENKLDNDWENFASHFDIVHSDFLRTLKAKYPNLSSHELKLCAYLRMNLSSKEIAQLMNISVRGVEISRYRLRKKFQISTETNLFNFLLEVSGEKE